MNCSTRPGPRWTIPRRRWADSSRTTGPTARQRAATRTSTTKHAHTSVPSRRLPRSPAGKASLCRPRCAGQIRAWWVGWEEPGFETGRPIALPGDPHDAATARPDAVHHPVVRLWRRWRARQDRRAGQGAQRLQLFRLHRRRHHSRVRKEHRHQGDLRRLRQRRNGGNQVAGRRQRLRRGGAHVELLRPADPGRRLPAASRRSSATPMSPTAGIWCSSRRICPNSRTVA